VGTNCHKHRYRAAYSSPRCHACPQRARCPVKPGKHYHYGRYDEKAHRLAPRRAHQQTMEFRDRYRWRAGVEGTMSQYDRLTGVKRLRVRGLKPVRFCATLKAEWVMPGELLWVSQLTALFNNKFNMLACQMK